MAVRVRAGRWARARAVVIESELLRATVLPEHGARIASLVYIPEDREVLWTPPGFRALPTPTYGMPYADQPAVGIDECLPTIGVDTFNGRALPDHGEAWAVPWDVRKGREAIETEVTLRRSPLRFNRLLSFVRDDAIRLDYTVTNTSNAPEPVLWALHPLMRWENGTRVILPPEVTDFEVGTVMGISPLRPNTTAGWPQVERLDLGGVQLNQNGEPAAMKGYVGPLTERWAALHDMLAGIAVGFAFTTPMLGLWLNRGAWGGFTHVALEPTTGTSDLLSEAMARENVLTVPANESASWSVTIGAAGGIAAVRGVTPDGRILT
jgi:galactose mutarotase-like enzyme